MIENQVPPARRPASSLAATTCLSESGDGVRYASNVGKSEIIQLKSANQMAQGGGGAASCGYYAIFNANAIILSIFYKTTYKENIAEMQKQHLDSYKTGPLDNTSTGKQVKAVLNYNYSRVVRGYIEDQMLAYYTFERIDNPNGLVAQGIKRSQLRDDARAIIRTIARARYQQLFGNVTGWDINKLQNIVVSVKQLSEEIEKHKNKVLLIKFFKELFKNINQNLQLNFTPEKARGAYNNLHYNDPAQRIKYQGDWLDDNELSFLVNTAVKPNFQKNNLPEISFTYVTQDDLQWLDVTNQVAQLKRGIPVVFILGTQSQNGGGYRHWYTLVVNKCSDKLQYIIADSWAERGSQLNSPEVQAVIKKIGNIN